MFNEIFGHNAVKFNYDGSENPYLTFEDYVLETKSQKVKVLGVWVNPKGKYGARGVIVLDGVNLNAPAHLIKDINAIRSNPELVDGINQGKCGLVFRTYEVDGKTFYSGRFCDWED